MPRSRDDEFSTELPMLCSEADQPLLEADQPVHASAYLLWRINWIHPFHDGNGRIAWELAYLALLVQCGLTEIGGAPSIPELIDQDRTRYERYLQDADYQWTIKLEPGVQKLESLISGLLVEQAESAMKLDD